MFNLNYSNETSEKILKALVNAGKIKADELVTDDNGQIPWAEHLRSLIHDNQITENWLVSMLTQNASLARAFPEEEKVQTNALSSLPINLLKEHSILPYRFEDKTLKILMLDPFVRKSLNTALRETSNQEVIFEITSLSHLEMLYGLEVVQNGMAKLSGQSKNIMPPPIIPQTPFDEVVRTESEQTISKLSESSPIKVATASELSTGKAHEEDDSEDVDGDEVEEVATPTKPEPEKIKREAPTRQFKFRDKWQATDPDLVIKFCDQILMDSIISGASDIHIECFRDMAQVRMRTDGTMTVKKNYNEYLYKNYASVIARFKILADCDISERRLPQDGAITFKGPRNEDIDFRFNIMPTKNGERIVMRILAGDPALSLDKLGFDKNDYQKIIDAIESPQGMVLVTGPTGSGKTTTLYGALQYINRPDINILTAEDPVEYYLQGAGQVQANEKIGLTFSSILRAFLRQDPEVILVGEIRDQETIDIAIKAALTGHLLLSTLHTNDAIATITRIQNMGVPNFMISSALSIVVAQRLAKKSCQGCLEDDPRATDENLLKIGFSLEEITTFTAKRGSGCKVCGGTGLKGRQGIYEVLRMTKEIEAAILKNAQAPEILEAARKDGFRTMQEIAREFVVKGILSIEEFQSCLNLDH